MSSPFDLNDMSMTPREVVAFAVQYVQSGRRTGMLPPLLWGSWGIGKSEMAAYVAQLTGREFVPFFPLESDSTELRFTMRPEDDKLKFFTPAIFQTAKPTLFCIDEISRVPPMMQNVLLRLVLNRQLGDLTLPDCVEVIAAGNPNGIGVQKLGDALASRFTHIDVKPALNDWVVWAVDHDIDPRVVGHIRYKGMVMLHRPDATKRVSPNPRAVANVSAILKSGFDPKTELIAMAGSCGPEFAASQAGFNRAYASTLQYLVGDLIANPMGAPIPDDPQVLFSVTTALVHEADRDNVERVMAYLMRLTPEYSSFAMRAIAKRDSNLVENRTYAAWAVANQGKQ